MPATNLASGALQAANSLGTSLLATAPPSTSSAADIVAKIRELETHVQGLHTTVTSFASQGPGTVSEVLVRLLALPTSHTLPEIDESCRT